MRIRRKACCRPAWVFRPMGESLTQGCSMVSPHGQKPRAGLQHGFAPWAKAPRRAAAWFCPTGESPAQAAGRFCPTGETSVQGYGTVSPRISSRFP
ncbi:MAG: hypothetical protein LBC40_07150 [Dysgonamonadaceae bacterium]|nr:hypothetical protein [Dysgonamonadaceae bacterium]